MHPTNPLHGLLLSLALATPLLSGCDELNQVADAVRQQTQQVGNPTSTEGAEGYPAEGYPAATGQPPPNAVSWSVLPARPADVVRIASFNIQVFGTAKEQVEPVMQILAEVVRQFDVVAIQEIRAADNQLIDRFVRRINATGVAYNYVLGPRLGRTVSKEQYAFVFNTRTLAVDPRSIQTVDDPDDLLHREPLIARFVHIGLPPEQAFSFTLIDMHTDPEEAAAEVDMLDDVFLATRGDGRYEDDVILLGDLNVDVRRLGQLGGVPGIYCTVQGAPTNTLGTKSYDNIVFDPAATAEFTGVSGVLDLQQAFGLTLEQAQAVSDHRPVWAEFSIFERRASFVAQGLGR